MLNKLKKLKDLTGKVRKSKDGKVLVENFISLSVLQAIGYVFPLITYPYLVRVIGINGFGKLAFAASIIVYFNTITLYGFNYTAVRYIAKNRNDIAKVSIIFCNVMYAKILLMLLSFSILAILIYTIPLFYENRLLLLLSFLIVPGSIMFPDWFFQAMEKMKYITIMNFLSKLFFTLLIFIIIKEKNDYIYQPILIALGYFISGFISLIILKRTFKIRFIIPNIKDVWNMIKNGFNMFISLFLPNLYTNFSVTLLGFYGGFGATGVFSSGKTFIDLCDNVSSILSRVFFPFLARRMDKHSLYVKISGTLSIIMSICLFLGADLLIKIFYTSEFASAANVIRIMSITPFFLFLMNTYGTNYLVLEDREDILRNIILVCSIGGFILAWIAISNFDYIGVAITITVVWGVRGILTWYYANKHKMKKHEK